jgi:glycosyltransferase involved in cell wall biosynthesis
MLAILKPADPDRQLRVVVLLDDLPVSGGGERIARQVTARLDPARFERTLCVSRWSAVRREDPAVMATVSEMEEAGVRFLGLRRTSRLAAWQWRPLLDLMRRERVDVLHTHMFSSNAWGAVLSKAAGVPVFVAHEHTWSFEGQPLRRALDRELIGRRADAFIAVSSEDRRRMIEIEGVDPDVIVRIFNGIPTPPRGDGDAARRRLGLNPGQPVIGTVCRIHPQKALEVLVAAAEILRSDHPALRVLIVGDGPARPEIEREIERRGVGGTVEMLGERTDVPDLIAAMDVAVNCSDFEGMPLAVIEFMAAAKPIVATRVGGLTDLIEDGVDGRLVEPRDPAALARSVSELLADPEQAARLGERARERQVREFDIDVTAQRIGRLYEELVARKSAPTR